MCLKSLMLDVTIDLLLQDSDMSEKQLALLRAMKYRRYNMRQGEIVQLLENDGFDNRWCGKIMLRKLQGRAIKAVELLFPNANPGELEQAKLTAQPPAPTVAEARATLYPELEWCWREWVKSAEWAGHKV